MIEPDTTNTPEFSEMGSESQSLELAMDQSLDDHPKISMHVLDGQAHPYTFRLSGKLTNQSVQVLIDSGFTHNFIQYRLV